MRTNGTDHRSPARGGTCRRRLLQRRNFAGQNFERSAPAAIREAATCLHDHAGSRQAADPTPVRDPARYRSPTATRHYKAGKYGEATEVFEQYTVEKPDNAWGHFMLGLSASKGGDPAKAEKAFEEAIRIDPKHVKSLLNLSRVLIDKGRFDDASLKLTHVGRDRSQFCGNVSVAGPHI